VRIANDFEGPKQHKSIFEARDGFFGLQLKDVETSAMSRAAAP